MKLNYLRLIKNYGGKWVALNNDSSKVVASSSDAKKVYKQAKSKGFEIPKLYKVPNKYQPNIG